MVAKRRRGFTLIEVLIVVVIMAVLAATIIPQFSSSTQDAQDSQVEFNRHMLQSQIQLYKAQHGGTLPAITNNLEALVKKTDADGTVNTTSGKFGPYVLEIPVNPNTSAASVSASTDGSEATGGGWLYDASTGKVWADSPAAP